MLNAAGEVEMDAMMMDGNSLGCVHFLRGKQGMDGHPGAHTQPFRQFKVHPSCVPCDLVRVRRCERSRQLTLRRAEVCALTDSIKHINDAELCTTLHCTHPGLAQLLQCSK